MFELAWSYSITRTGLDKLRDLIHERNLLFCKTYGAWKSTINSHMLFHLPDDILLNGPATAR